MDDRIKLVVVCSVELVELQKQFRDAEIRQISLEKLEVLTETPRLTEALEIAARFSQVKASTHRALSALIQAVEALPERWD